MIARRQLGDFLEDVIFKKLDFECARFSTHKGKPTIFLDDYGLLFERHPMITLRWIEK